MIYLYWIVLHRCNIHIRICSLIIFFDIFTTAAKIKQGLSEQLKISARHSRWIRQLPALQHTNPSWLTRAHRTSRVVQGNSLCLFWFSAHTLDWCILLLSWRMKYHQCPSYWNSKQSDCGDDTIQVFKILLVCSPSCQTNGKKREGFEISMS